MFCFSPIQFFPQWYDSLRAVARLPAGIPTALRKKFWLSLANRHVQHLKLDWTKTVRFAFNDRSNPDDDKLGVQIVKVNCLVKFSMSTIIAIIVFNKTIPI